MLFKQEGYAKMCNNLQLFNLRPKVAPLLRKLEKCDAAKGRYSNKKIQAFRAYR